MKNATIKLLKQSINTYVDEATYKRVEATMSQTDASEKNAIASDALEANDGFLIRDFCNSRDAEIRQRLAFCLVDNTTESLSFTNNNDESTSYDYTVSVEDEFTQSQLQSVGTKMDAYIKRGAVLSWYLNAGLTPTDSEVALSMLLDDIVYALRGRAWGHRPMQPFGPMAFNFRDGNTTHK